MSESIKASVWLENSKGEQFPVVGTCSLGRAPTNQIALADERASRRHALVHAQEQHQYWLVDLGSSNGTLLNGRRVSQPTELRDTDRIEIGATALTFRQPSATATTVTRAAASDQTVVDIKSDPCWLLVADIIGSTCCRKNFALMKFPCSPAAGWPSANSSSRNAAGASTNFSATVSSPIGRTGRRWRRRWRAR